MTYNIIHYYDLHFFVEFIRFVYMALAKEDFNKIGAYIREHLGEWLKEEGFSKRSLDYELEMRERIVRVEEELKHQRELMKQGFEMMNKRLEQVDKRFEVLTKRIDRFMIWSFGLMLTLTGVVIAVIKL